MPRPKKYDNDLYGPQRAYFKTEKGKAALKKAQGTEKFKEQKREWWRKNRGKNSIPRTNRKQFFIDTYGDPHYSLQIIEDEAQRKVVELYFGLSDDPPMNQKAIANKLGTSIATVSRTNKEALAKLETLKQSVANN